MSVNFKKIGNDKIQVPLNLPSGESVFIETFSPLAPKGGIEADTKSPFGGRGPKSEIVLRGSWQVDFVKGDPNLPKGFKTNKLDSWTTLSTDTMAQYFSGTARYTLIFNSLANQVGKSGWLELGDVRESATVKLNGKMLGTAWSLPFRVPITEGVLLKGNNKLEIEVTNVEKSAASMKALPPTKTDGHEGHDHKEDVKPAGK